MNIRFNAAAIGQTKWYEYALRFLFGGTVTVITGLVAKKYGPGIGGLFLAFPAIFPATATLIEKHERQQKERAGLHGAKRGRMAAGMDAAGTAIGSLGLVAFGLMVWEGLPYFRPTVVIIGATLLWFMTSFLIWYVRKFVW